MAENTDLAKEAADLSEHCEELKEDLSKIQRQGQFEADKAELLRRLQGAHALERLTPRYRASQSHHPRAQQAGGRVVAGAGDAEAHDRRHI